MTNTTDRSPAAPAERPAKATRKGRETDAAFRDAARAVFARDGYLNARISDIAAEAGKSVASFYNYYDTKAALLVALAEEFHEEATELAVLPFRAGSRARNRCGRRWRPSGARTPNAAAN